MTPAPDDEIRIGLLWHSASAPNLGVGALTLANISIARRAAENLGLAARFTVIGFGNEAQSYAPEDVVACHTVDRRFLLGGEYLSVLSGLDCLLDIGGGDSFADIYGRKRFFYLWVSKALAVWRSTPLLLSPQTIGPFNLLGSKKLAGWAMSKASVTCARDPQSFDEIARIAPKARRLQSIDVAFALPYSNESRSGGTPPIGLNVSGMLFNQAQARRDPFGFGYDYAEYTRELIRSLLANGQCGVELITHVCAPQQEMDDDWRVAQQLAKEFPDAVLIAPFQSPSDAKAHISRLGFLISGRMHACIAAHSAGVPFVATSYSRKFEGLFGALAYGGVLERKCPSVRKALEFTLTKLSEKDMLQSEIQAGSRSVSALLGEYEAALTDFFAYSRQ